jgi:hypothetical protein
MGLRRVFSGGGNRRQLILYTFKRIRRWPFVLFAQRRTGIHLLVVFSWGVIMELPGRLPNELRNCQFRVFCRLP